MLSGHYILPIKREQSCHTFDPTLKRVLNIGQTLFFQMEDIERTLLVKPEVFVYKVRTSVIYPDLKNIILKDSLE